VLLYSFLTSALHGGEWSTSHPGRFHPGKENQHAMNWRPGGPQSRSRRFGEEKTLVHAETGTADGPARSAVDVPTVARRTTLTCSHQKSTEGQ
jgi:hypothetical protein